MEGLLRAVFIVQIVSASVMALSVVVLVVYAIRTSEQLRAAVRAAQAAEKAARDLQAGGAAAASTPLPDLERWTDELSGVSRSLEQIPTALEGLKQQLGSASLGVASSPVGMGPDAWRAEVAKGLKQFRVLWTAFYAGNRERLEPEFAGDLQASARAIADSLLGLLASRPARATSPTASALLGVVVTMQELADLELDPDDSRTLDQFDELGARTLELIRAIE